MKAILAQNKETGKFRVFSTVKELMKSEVGAGRSKKDLGNVYNALSPKTRYSGFNGWMLKRIEIDD